MRAFWSLLNAMRPAIFVAAISFFLLSLPEQIQELYLINVDAALLPPIPTAGHARAIEQLAAVGQVILSIAASTLLAFVLWLGSIRLIEIRQPAQESRAVGGATYVLAASIATMPLLGVLSGLNNTLSSLASNEQLRHS